MEAAGTRRPDVHAGALPHRLEALEEGDVLGSVARAAGRRAVGVGGVGQAVSFWSFTCVTPAARSVSARRPGLLTDGLHLSSDGGVTRPVRCDEKPAKAHKTPPLNHVALASLTASAHGHSRRTAARSRARAPRRARARRSSERAGRR